MTAKQEKAAILIYPQFSNYEISIAAAIFKGFEKEFGGIKKPIRPEDYIFYRNA